MWCICSARWIWGRSQAVAQSCVETTVRTGKLHFVLVHLGSYTRHKWIYVGGLIKEFQKQYKPSANIGADYHIWALNDNTSAEKKRLPVESLTWLHGNSSRVRSCCQICSLSPQFTHMWNNCFVVRWQLGYWPGSPAASGRPATGVSWHWVSLQTSYVQSRETERLLPSPEAQTGTGSRGGAAHWRCLPLTPENKINIK